MQTPDEPGIDAGPDMTAAELALGLLDGAERNVALRRLVDEPAFAADVERWRDWLSALFAGWPAVEAPADVATRIEAALDARYAEPIPVVPANDNDRRWRMLALGASIAACLLLALTTMLALRPAPAPQRIPVPVAAPAPLIAAIAPTDKGAPIAAAYDPSSGEVRIEGAVAVPAGRSAEVWAIQGKAAPRSLGVMPASAHARMIVPANLRPAMAAETLLAISIEPAGGSPTGLPTGPVVAAGKLSG